MKSEALRIAQLSARTQLQSQCLNLLTDPLWSTILGFVAVNQLRKKDLIGPVADDFLYAGIIAINTGRSPGITELAGKGIELLGTGAAVAGGVLAGGAAKTIVSRLAPKAIAGPSTPLVSIASKIPANVGLGTSMLGMVAAGGVKSYTKEEIEAIKQKPWWKRVFKVG